MADGRFEIDRYGVRFGRVSIPTPRRACGRSWILFADVLDHGPGCWDRVSVVVHGWDFTVQVRRRGEYSPETSKGSCERRMPRLPRRPRERLSCGCCGFVPKEDRG